MPSTKDQDIRFNAPVITARFADPFLVAGFWPSLVMRQGRFSSLRCGDSTTPSSMPTHSGKDRGMAIESSFT